MPPIKILVFTANPDNTDRLQFPQEVREIEAEIERSRFRDQVQVVNKGAVRIDDLTPSITTV